MFTFNYTYTKQNNYNLKCFLCPLLALEVLQDTQEANLQSLVNS